MKKGQITLDLMLTFILMIVVITGFSGVILNFKNTQEKILVQEQLYTISSKTSSLITATQALADTNFTIALHIDKINYADAKGNNVITRPQIRVDESKLIVFAQITTNEGDVLIDSNNYFYKNPSTKINTDNLQTNGILVITNE
ncbi:MAG: hypothetical protein WCW13_03875 [archaeon]|jgi:hypothetical protein